MLNTLIFDFDGVIHDTFELVYQLNSQLMPGLTRDDYRDIFNGNIYKHARIDDKQVMHYFEKQERAFGELKIERQIRNELLELKKHYFLHIISSNMERILNAYFERNDLKGLFDSVLGYETHKSKVRKFNIILQGMNKDESVFITDTLGDILEANKVGLRTIAVDYGFHDRKRLERGSPYTIVSDFAEIRRAIERL